MEYPNIKNCMIVPPVFDFDNAGFDEKMVKMKTGHRSDAVREYQVPGFDMRKAASDALVARGSSSKQI